MRVVKVRVYRVPQVFPSALLGALLGVADPSNLVRNRAAAFELLVEPVKHKLLVPDVSPFKVNENAPYSVNESLHLVSLVAANLYSKEMNDGDAPLSIAVQAKTLCYHC